jgi:hypothetical protein
MNAMEKESKALLECPANVPQEAWFCNKYGSFLHFEGLPPFLRMVYSRLHYILMPRRASTSPKPVEIDRSRGPLIAAVVFMVGLGITAGTIAWGRSDAGQINVAATINNSNGAAPVDESGAPMQAATTEHSNLPNGGLVPADPNATPAPTPAPTEEPATASSTEATTTDSVETTQSEESVNTNTSDAPAS